jgi:hypothetical protein
MDSWTNQMGFPVVHISKTSPGKGKAVQEHFLLNSNGQDVRQSDLGWVCRLANETSFCLLLTRHERIFPSHLHCGTHPTPICMVVKWSYHALYCEGVNILDNLINTVELSVLNSVLDISDIHGTSHLVILLKATVIRRDRCWWTRHQVRGS